MYNDNYIKVYFSDFEDELLTNEPFSKLHAWADLLFLANTESNITIRGSVVCLENGEVRMSLRDLCKRWGWGNTRMNSFLRHLEECGKITINKGKISTAIKVEGYSTYLGTKSQNASPTKSHIGVTDIADNVEVTGGKTENFGVAKSPTKSLTKSPEKTFTPTKSPTKSHIGITDIADNVEVTGGKTALKKENASPTKSPSTKNKEEREERKENKKENFPHTPIKEINKEKKEETRRNPLTPNVVSCYTPACASVRERTRAREGENETEPLLLTCEEPTKEKSEKKSVGKEQGVVWKARLAFSDFYKERYGEDKYWKVSEMTALKQLMKQIRYSRLHKTTPLPVDDDSLLSAFVELLKNICTPWILQNFLVTNINSKYDTIVQDIKNKRNGTSSYSYTTNAYQSGQALIEHQKQACINEIAELERKLASGEIVPGRREISEADCELPDF